LARLQCSQRHRENATGAFATPQPAPDQNILMFQLNQIRIFSGDNDRHPIFVDDIDTAKISLVTIFAVFAIQLTSGGIALLVMAR
jgi:hypothetical protein